MHVYDFCTNIKSYSKHLSEHFAILGLSQTYCLCRPYSEFVLYSYICGKKNENSYYLSVTKQFVIYCMRITLLLNQVYLCESLCNTENVLMEAWKQDI